MFWGGGQAKLARLGSLQGCGSVVVQRPTPGRAAADFDRVSRRAEHGDAPGYFVEQGPKKRTGTVGKRLNHFKTRLSTEPVPIFGLPSFQFEYKETIGAKRSVGGGYPCSGQCQAVRDQGRIACHRSEDGGGFQNFRLEAKCCVFPSKLDCEMLTGKPFIRTV